ncbi:MAG TPA: hypothetical protein VEG60_11215 [Candidatus Binatia bacterium]|nr:hypothetical protein [Candidatus Binatia bacterium]
MRGKIAIHLGQIRRPQLVCTRFLVVSLFFPLIASACNLKQPPQEQRVGNVGYFQFQAPRDHLKGVVIGAPSAGIEPGSAEYAKWISERTGAGFLIASGFASKRLAVTQPLVRTTLYPVASEDPIKRGSIYREFKAQLKHVAGGKVLIYIGLRLAPPSQTHQIEVASSGFTFEELEFLRQSFLRVRDRLLIDSEIEKVGIAFDPLDEISSSVSGIKHHGVLLSAERGLNLRLPQSLSANPMKSIYKTILADWISEALLREQPQNLPRTTVKMLDYGRIDSIPPRTAHPAGIVIGAPHGTFDEHTAELVEGLSYRTGLPAVVAKGFSPTQCGGWRINVNRPTEGRYPAGEIEIGSERAESVYHNFKEAVINASQSDLSLYIDIHQNGQQKNIELATVGISNKEAQFIKKSYREARDRILPSVPGVASVDLMVEPLDPIEIGAWATKSKGMLALAKKGLHFEFPLYSTLGSRNARGAYGDILALLLGEIGPVLLKTE